MVALTVPSNPARQTEQPADCRGGASLVPLLEGGQAAIVDKVL